jgi:hypothetical protein
VLQNISLEFAGIPKLNPVVCVPISKLLDIAGDRAEVTPKVNTSDATLDAGGCNEVPPKLNILDVAPDDVGDCNEELPKLNPLLAISLFKLPDNADG